MENEEKKIFVEPFVGSVVEMKVKEGKGAVISIKTSDLHVVELFTAHREFEFTPRVFEDPQGNLPFEGDESTGELDAESNQED